MQVEKQVIVSGVSDGKLEPWKGTALVAAIGKHEGKMVQISVTPFAPLTTSKQLRFVNGVFVPALWKLYVDHGQNISPELVRDCFKEMFGAKEAIVHPDGEVTYRPKSMREWTRKETSDAIENARAHYAPYGKLPIPNSEDLSGETNATT